MNWKPILVGLVLIPINSLLILLAWISPTFAVPFYNVILFLFVLLAINGFCRAVRLQSALKPSELGLIYIMLSCSTAINLPSTFNRVDAGYRIPFLVHYSRERMEIPLLQIPTRLANRQRSSDPAWLYYEGGLAFIDRPTYRSGCGQSPAGPPSWWFWFGRCYVST